MTADAKRESKPAKKRKADPPSAAKYKPHKSKDTSTTKTKETAEKSKNKPQPDLSNFDANENQETDAKNFNLILAISITTNILILSAATALFALSASCNGTEQSHSNAQAFGPPDQGRPFGSPANMPANTHSSSSSSPLVPPGHPSGNQVEQSHSNAQAFGPPDQGRPSGSPANMPANTHSSSSSSPLAPPGHPSGNQVEQSHSNAQAFGPPDQGRPSGSPANMPANTHSSSSSSPSAPPGHPSGNQEGAILTEFDVITNHNHQCGVSDIQPDLQSGRIVGGYEAVPNSWPFTVGIGVLNLLGGNRVNIMQMCGGTLISPRHALTAAHCFKDDPYGQNPYSVFAAVHSTETYKGLQPMRVAVVRIHPKTNAFTENPWIVYDFALLTLYKEFVPNSKVQIACLPSLRKVLPEGTICWATGWGKTQGTGAENLLKQVAIDVVSEKTCQLRYNPDIVMKSTLCGGTKPGQDTCQGDSGGPLYHQETGKWVLYGVTSYGSENCGTGPMAAYGTVSYNLEWICCFMASMPGCAGIKCVPSGEN